MCSYLLVPPHPIATFLSINFGIAPFIYAEMCDNRTLEFEEQSSTSTPLINDLFVYVSTQLEYA